MCDKRRTGQWGNPVSCFFAPEKWKFPIPSAYNTGRVSFQTRSERMIIMTKGIVKIKKNRAFVEQQNGEVEVASGQYVYLKVENCWIPVVVRYSARKKKWYFKYLEEIPVCGQKVLLKA